MKYAVEITSLVDNMREFNSAVTVEAESFDDAFHNFQAKLRARELKWEPKTVYEDEIDRILISLSEE